MSNALAAEMSDTDSSLSGDLHGQAVLSRGSDSTTASQNELTKVPLLCQAAEMDDQEAHESDEDLIRRLPSLGYYLRHAFHTTDGPKSPTWAYSGGSADEHENIPARAIMWISIVLVLAGVFLWQDIVNDAFYYLGRLLVFYPTLHYLGNFIVLYAFPLPEKGNHRNDPAYLSRIGCIIPCHKSADEVVHTVNSVLAFCKPEHIVVVDNGNSLHPLDNTEERLRELEPKVQYKWLPVGHKCNALWVGLHALPDTAEFVMHIDDDTILPPDMVFDEKVWEHSETAAVSYGISMFQTGMVERLVDFEFKLISHHMYFLSRLSSVVFCYGIIGLWRRSAFRARLHEHPYLPWGEDSWIGHINMLKNAQIRQEVRCFVSTYAPSALLPFSGSREQGYGAANVWKQRTQRWFCNQPRRFLHRLAALFSYRHDTLTGNVVFRLEILLHLLSTMVVLAIPLHGVACVRRNGLMALAVMKAEFLAVTVVKGWVFCLLVSTFLWRKRPELQVSPMTIFLMPFYHIFLAAAMIVGHWRCVLYYIPFIPMRHGLYTEGRMTGKLLKNLHNIDVSGGKMDQGARELVSELLSP
jgi:hypothetical protein